MKKKQLRKELKCAGQLSARGWRLMYHWRSEATQLQADIKQLQADACKEMAALKARIAHLEAVNDNQFAKHQVARAEHECDVEALKATIETQRQMLETAQARIVDLLAQNTRLLARGNAWVPVEDGVTGDADGGMTLTISDNGQTIMLRDDSPGCKELGIGDLRICRKV